MAFRNNCSVWHNHRVLHLTLLVLLLSNFSACSSLSQSASPIIVEWTTASEISTAGFNLYRSEQENGTYTKLNASLIPTSGDQLSGSKYSFEDKNVQAGKTYYYKLEDVEQNGDVARHGPIVITAPLWALDQVALVVVLCMLTGIGLFFAWRFRKIKTVSGKGDSIQ